MSITRVCVGVFVHNEEENLGAVLDDLRNQSLPSNLRVAVFVLCNGCTDGSAAVARSHAQAWTTEERKSIEIWELRAAGKARTWNSFVSSPEASRSEVCVFVDADIRLREPSALARLIEDVLDPAVVAAVSEPVAHLPEEASPTLRRVFEQTKTAHLDGAICGQLYAVRTAAIRDVRLPVPCLVEDGFLAACLITRLFEHEPRLSLVRASHRVRHDFEAESSLSSFFRHSVRLALGTEMNAAYFTPLWAGPDRAARIRLLEQMSKSEGVEEAFAHHENRLRRALRPPASFATGVTRAVRRPGPWSRLPVRFARGVYDGAVLARARHLFRHRTFAW